MGNLAINQPGTRQMTEEQKKKLEQKLRDIAHEPCPEVGDGVIRRL
jgi:hypothetical protein